MRLVNDALSRMLHNALYNRMISFCNTYTPEFPAEPIVTSWLSRLYSGDDNLHMLVTFDKTYNITGHCVIDVQRASGYSIIFCHQLQMDKGNQVSLDEGMEYIDKLAIHVGAHCTVVNMSKGNKVLEKKYGYGTVRSVMLKLHGESNDL